MPHAKLHAGSQRFPLAPLALVDGRLSEYSPWVLVGHVRQPSFKAGKVQASEISAMFFLLKPAA